MHDGGRTPSKGCRHPGFGQEPLDSSSTGKRTPTPDNLSTPITHEPRPGAGRHGLSGKNAPTPDDLSLAGLGPGRQTQLVREKVDLRAISQRMSRKWRFRLGPTVETPRGASPGRRGRSQV